MISNKDLKELVDKFKLFKWLAKDSIEFKKVQDELSMAFYTLSENIVRKSKFNIIDPNDAIQEGVMICFEKIDRFDSNKGKVFNYMTTCILGHLRQIYR